jgi:hypothetical protein
MQDQMFAGIRVQVLTLGTKYLFHYMSNLSTIFLSHLYAPPPPPPHSARNSICRCSMNNPSTMQRLPLPTRLRCRQPVTYLAFSSSTLHELLTCTSPQNNPISFKPLDKGNLVLKPSLVTKVSDLSMISGYGIERNGISLARI